MDSTLKRGGFIKSPFFETFFSRVVRARNLTKLREETLKKHYTAKWETFRRQLYFYGFKSYEKDKFWSQPKLDRQNKEVTIHVVISICFPDIFILLGISYRK